MKSLVEQIRHYALETMPSIYDEEALTALQLCGRVASKVNEVIRAFQDLSRGTASTLEEFESATIPNEVRGQIQTLINTGEFDKAIDLYCGELSARLDNILVNGSAEKDAELVDARMDHRGPVTGTTWPTVGAMLRFWLSEFEWLLNSIVTWQTAPVQLDMILGYVNTSGEFIVENLATHKCATVDTAPGLKYRVKTSYGHNMPSFVVQDENHYPIMYGLTHEGGTAHCNYDQVVTMPARARYLIINSMNGYFCGLQEVHGVNSNALDGDYITNALAGVMCGPLNQAVVPGKKAWEAHALKNGEVVPLSSGDTGHIVALYKVRPGYAYNLKTGVSFGCNPYVFRNEYGSIIDKLIVAPEETTEVYDVKIRAPIGATELLVYFPTGYETKVTMDNGCIPNVPTPANAPGYPDWSHLKWYAMGDSITERNGFASKRYYDYIQEKTGIQVIVDGIGGTGFYAGYDEHICYPARLGNIPADVDVITLFASGNDISVLREEEVPATVVKETLYDMLNTFNHEWPGVPVVVFLPTRWKGYGAQSQEWESLCQAIEEGAKNVGGLFYCITDTALRPPFDGNIDSHIPLFFSKDAAGIHPDENGHKALAPIFYNALASVLACK